MTDFINASDAATISEGQKDSNQNDFIAQHYDLMNSISNNIRGNAQLGASKTWLEIDDTELSVDGIRLLKEVLKFHGYRVKMDFVLSENLRGGGLGLSNIKFDDDFYDELANFPHYTVDIYIFWA